MTKYRAKRIGDGHYLYRGYSIRRYPSEGMLGKAKYIWEAEDEHKCGFAHASTFGYCKHLIDEEFNEEMMEWGATHLNARKEE